MQFVEGQRIELLAMPDDPDPIPVGTRGLILNVTRGFRPGEIVLSVRWDNGRSLNVITPPDRVRLVATP